MPVEKTGAPLRPKDELRHLRGVLGKLEVALGATRDGIAWTDASGRIEWSNAPFDRLCGKPHMVIIGSSITDALPLDDHPAAEVLSSRSFLSRVVAMPHGQGRRYLECFGSWAQGGGVPPMAVFVLRDVTARVEREEELRRAHEQLKEKSEALARSNAELQQFASAASHDLMEPLRKVAAFGDLLRKRASAVLDPQSLEFLDRMQNAALRMGTLIDDLLQFSRVFGDTRPFGVVDLGEVARGVAGDLERAVEAAGGRVEIGELPIVDAHPFQMRQLFQNLIANALKFRRADEPPVVSVRPLPPDDGYVSFEIADNGIGFEEKYAESIFEPFLRLHTRTEYPGTGLGLAICRRILLRHGGWITAKSEPGRGSAFVVTMSSSPSPSRSATSIPTGFAVRYSVCRISKSPLGARVSVCTKPERPPA